MSSFFCNDSTVIIGSVTFYINKDKLKSYSINTHLEGIGSVFSIDSAKTLVTEEQAEDLINIGVVDRRRL